MDACRAMKAIYSSVVSIIGPFSKIFLCSDLTENGKRLLYTDCMFSIIFSDPCFNSICQLDVTIIL